MKYDFFLINDGEKLVEVGTQFNYELAIIYKYAKLYNEPERA